jgi:hypothetical protein
MPNEWMHVYVTAHTNSRNITYGLYREVPKTHDNEDCVTCIECVYII